MKFDENQKYFWRDDAILLDRSAVVLPLVEQLDEAEQKAFWAGTMPYGLIDKLDALPDRDFIGEIMGVFKNNPKSMVDSCMVRASQGKASDYLHFYASGVIKLSEFEKGIKSETVTYGDLDLDKRRWEIEQAKNPNSRIGDDIVKKAIKDGDSNFLIAVGEAMKAEPEEQSKIAKYLVKYWCGESGHQSQGRPDVAPPLCLFSDEAIGNYLGMVLEIPEQFDNVRKWRQRLKLARLEKGPIIKKVFPTASKNIIKLAE